MVILGNLKEDFCPGRPGLLAVGIGIFHNQIAALRLGPADLVRLLHQPVQLGLADRPHENHDAAVRQVGIQNSAIRPGNDIALLKAKRCT
jgi:hypothetical protein